MEKITVKIYVEEPIVFVGKNGDTVLTATRDLFSGTALRGALAGRYIENKCLGKDAHTDELFRKLFLTGELRFVAAYPAVGEERSLVLPLSIQKLKVKPARATDKASNIAGQVMEIQDLAFTSQYAAGYKGLKGYAQIEAGTIKLVEVEKNISLHIDRSSDQERISGKSETGKIYNYESIMPSQTFIGEVVGEKKALTDLVEGINLAANDVFYFGRSKYTQYGKCRLSFGKPTAIAGEKVAAKTICLRCDTPFIPEGLAANAKSAFGECVDFLNESCNCKDFSLIEESIIAATESVENFVGAWGMRRPDETALSAGSIFKIKNTGEWSETTLKALEDLMYGGVGRRCSEGFGQFRIWREQELKKVNSLVKEKPIKPVIESGVKVLASRIVMQCILSKMQQFAFADAEKVKNSLREKKHLFSRLEDMLGDRQSMQGKKNSFINKFKASIRPKSQAEKHLQSIKLNGKDLKDILSGEAMLPYEAKLDWIGLLGNNIKSLAKDIEFKLPDKNNDEIFYEYWLWFFRHGRKKAGKNGKEAGVDE